MSKSAASGIPGVDAMTDTLEFVKNMWGSMKIPGMVMPSMSVDDINKQIADLKAVESWLTLNMNMLRGTIQALEVQSATIATLKSMGETVSAMVKPDGMGRQAAPKMPESGGAGAVQDWPLFRGSQSAGEAAFSFSPPTADMPHPPRESEPAPDTGARAPVAPDGGNAALMAAPFANPAAWWNMLQDQFKQAVSSAIAQEPQQTAQPGNSGAASPQAESGTKSGSAARSRSKKASAAKTASKRTPAAKKAAAPARRRTASKS